MNINFERFFAHIDNTRLKTFSDELKITLEASLEQHQKHGEWQDWMQALDTLPEITISELNLNNSAPQIGTADDCSPEVLEEIKTALMSLHPWRKGPFNLFGMHIDTEWRSDFKWDRLAPHISPLDGKYVLDIGCGSGYHCLRMQAQAADCVIGVDPTSKFFAQFLALNHYMQLSNTHYLPIKAEQLPKNMQAFDTVFSMGVLYHRRSPFEHLDLLKQMLKKGGELILETLIIEGDEESVLVPLDRYACMRNVWFLPSIDALKKWMKRSGWKNIRHVDTNITSFDEQRTTEWMHFRSLKDFLDPTDSSLTLEGYPAPKRAILIANK